MEPSKCHFLTEDISIEYDEKEGRYLDVICKCFSMGFLAGCFNRMDTIRHYSDRDTFGRGSVGSPNSTLQALLPVIPGQ